VPSEHEQRDPLAPRFVAAPAAPIATFLRAVARDGPADIGTELAGHA
jgi:hypothetical protein